ncbi:MAG: RnfABCDGE type electron transport complex subunit D [Oscillospiraceae bacterium]|nr:RnfABCDGE type electron transport complex subunit D [Oscillospiraceae bacterium]
MTSEKLLTAGASPHIRSGSTTRRIMLDVIIALAPSLAAAAVIFGPRTLAVAAVTVGTCVLAEYLSRRVMKRDNTVGDLSAAVTGLILAFNLPSTIPLWMAAFGSVAAVVVVKQMFGGIGQNFVNPALTARIILMVSFPAAMTASWPGAFMWRSSADAVTSATPLALMKDGGELPSLLNMLFAKSGSLGEVCAFTLILGGVYLVIRRVISPVIPLCFIGTVAAAMFLYGLASRDDAFTFMIYELLGGGLMLGAVFMATDYATSPVNTAGRIVFAVGCGLLTFVIRIFGGMTEGVSFAILIMNILVPHIERLTAPKPFGYINEKKQKEASKA